MLAVSQSNNPAEASVLRTFRTYQVSARQMLVLNHGHTKPPPASYARALQSLLERGLVVRERFPNAYSLTALGYQASLVA